MFLPTIQIWLIKINSLQACNALKDGDRNREKVYKVNDQDNQTSWNSFEEHNLYQFMYKPTERARVASPHFPTDWNRRSIETYLFE